MAGVLQPLGNQFPITNPDGTPTAYMVRWAQQRQIDISDSVTEQQVDDIINSIVATSPIVKTGTLPTGLTLSFNGGLDDLNDVDVTTVPPTDGQVLAYVAADSKWEPATPTGGGGGTGTLWLVTATGTGASQNITLTSAPPNKQSVLVSVNGIRYHTSDYTIVGTTLTLTTNASGDLIEIVGVLAGVSVAPPSGVTIRGSNITTSLSSATLVVPLPSGSSAGDFCLVFLGGHNAWSGAPSGWTTVDSQSGSFYNGYIVSKLLTSGDITTGSVTFGFGGGPEDQVAVAVTFVGATSGVGTFVSQRNSGGSASRVLTTSVASVPADLVLCFGTNRDNSTDTVSIGTILQQSSASTASAVMTTSAALAGTQTATFNYSAFGSGDYQAILTVTP